MGFVLFVVQSTHNKNHCKEDREHLGWKIISLGTLLKGILKLIGNDKFSWSPVWIVHNEQDNLIFSEHSRQKSDKNVIEFAPVMGKGGTFPSANFQSVKGVENPWGMMAWWEWSLLRRLPAHAEIKLSLQRSFTVSQEISSRWCLWLLMPWHTSQPCRSETSMI